jgi:hypothetical protein
LIVGRKHNIRVVLLYYYEIIGSYSESSIHAYSNGISYDDSVAKDRLSTVNINLRGITPVNFNSNQNKNTRQATGKFYCET